MRKALSLPFDIPPGIILPLLLLLISAAIIMGPAKGKVADATVYMKGAMPDWAWSCDTTVSEPVDFDEFMKKLGEVATACNADKTKCGTKTCVTADFGSPGDYMRVNEYVLHNYGLDMFNNYIIDIGVVSMGANVYCERTDADWGDYEIDPYYMGGTFDRSGLSTSTPNIKTEDGNEICWDYSAIHGEFAVAHDSKVMIAATYHENTIWSVTGHSVDLKVTVKGGTFTNDLTPSPQSECTPPDNTPCNTAPKPKWGHCILIDKAAPNKGGICQNAGYCIAYPENCKSFEVTCTQTETSTTAENTCSPNALTTECVKPPAAIVENGYKTTVGYLTQGGSLADKQLALYVLKDGQSSNTFIAKGKEKWYGTGALCLLGPCELSSSDPDAKVSVAITDIITDIKDGNTYTINGIQGCY